MEGVWMLLVMGMIAAVLALVIDDKQKKRVVALILCVAMMGSYIPVIHVAKADSASKPVLSNEQVLVNGTKTSQIGAVTYSTSGSAYELDASSTRVRVKNGDRISFEGTISAPEGETISWVRVDVYDANTEEPYTVGAEYYRADGLKVQQYDLSNIPALTIGEAFSRKGYTLAEGGKYIVMFCVGDSNGNTFADMDTVIEDNQGPAILVDVKLSPSNCKHPHSDYVYILHSSGEVRKQSYGDSMTHQVEPLYERYCGLCDTFLMNIWGEGTSEGHSMDSNGVCLDCGYYAEPMIPLKYAARISSLEFTSPNDGEEVQVGEFVTVQWEKKDGTEEYVVYVKLLDGEPDNGSDNEIGTLLDNQQNWKYTEYTMVIPESAAGKWIKFNVHGKTSAGEQTEAASSLYIYVHSTDQEGDIDNCQHINTEEVTSLLFRASPIEGDSIYHMATTASLRVRCKDCQEYLDSLYPPQYTYKKEYHYMDGTGICRMCGYSPVTIDNEQPEIENISVSPEKLSPGDTITYTVDVTDNLLVSSILIHYSWTSYEESGSNEIDQKNTSFTDSVVLPDKQGEYYIQVDVWDWASNHTTTQYEIALTTEEENETITLNADKTEVNAGETVTFTAQSNADSVTLYIEAYNEVAGEWYVAVTEEMAKNGSEYTYTHEFANAGSKRVYAETANGTTSDTIEITVKMLKETLEAPVCAPMKATVGEEVVISWGAVTNATGYTAHLYEMVDGKLESIGDLTSLVNGTSLEYTFTKTGEYHVGVTATAEGYNPSAQSAVIVTVEEASIDRTSPWLENAALVNDSVSVNGMIKLEGKVIDDTALKGIYLYIDGVDTTYYAHLYEMVEGKEYDLSEWKISWDEGYGLSEGYYSVKLDAEDSDGNFLEDGPVLLGYLTITGEETSPVINLITSTVASPITAGTEVTFSTTAADDVKLAKIELFIDDELKKTETVSDLSGTISYTTSALTIGEHIVKVVATDASGLTNDVSLTVTVQKAEYDNCPHNNTTKIRTEEYVSDAEQHKLVYTVWTHCLDCDTGLSNVQDEDLPEKHNWEDGVCKKCKHVCAHEYVADFNRPVNNSGVWKKIDQEYHIRDQIQYWEVCVHCSSEREGELRSDTSATKERHNMTNVTVIEYGYNSTTHQAIYDVTCSAKGCGHTLTYQRGNSEEHQFRNGKCSICGYQQLIVEDSTDNGDGQMNASDQAEDELHTPSDTLSDMLDKLEKQLLTNYRTSIEKIDTSYVDDYQLAQQILNEEYNTDPKLDALVALTDPFELYLAIVNAEWLERKMLEDMLSKIIGNIHCFGDTVEAHIEDDKQYLELIKFWKDKLGIAGDFLDENIIYTFITEDSIEHVTVVPVPDEVKEYTGELSDLLGRFSSISEEVMDYALFQLKAELAHFDVLEESLRGTNDELLESVITEMKFMFTNKFLGGVLEAAETAIEEVGSSSLDKILGFVGGKMGGIYSLAYKEILKASGIVDTVEGSRELIISDMYYKMINGEFRRMLQDFQSDPDSMTLEDINKLSAVYNLLNSALIVRNESAKKLVDENEVRTDTLVVQQLDAEIEQLKNMSLLNWKQNEYYDESFFEEPTIDTNKYYFEALLNVDYEKGSFGYTSRWDEMGTIEKEAVHQSIEELEEYEAGCGKEFVMHLVTDVNGAAHLILENEAGMGLLITCEQTSISDGSNNNIVVSTMTDFEVDNYAKDGRINASGVSNTGYLVDTSSNKVEAFLTLSIDEAEFERIMRSLVDNNYYMVEDGLSGYPFEMSRELVVSLLYDTYTEDLGMAEKVGKDKYEQILEGINKMKLEQIEGR